jgi:methylmalonyl-CoA mutase cobalamin-binding subunit
MKKTEHLYFIASVHDDYLDKMDQVAERLREKGCRINQILRVSGVISGSASHLYGLDELRREGIASIEKQRTLKKS